MTPRDEPQPGLARAVRQVRESREITQEDLADRAGVHRTWIGLLERNKVNPTWGSTKKVAEALGITHSALATLEEALDSESKGPKPAR
jgi:transcriptional regulator with XRE-family HTH domain